MQTVETYGGTVRLRWDPAAAVTAFGQMPYFIEFLKTAGLFEDWVEDCPLDYRSPNAPAKRDVLGTLLLSVLAGHRRYAHINSIRSDGVNPQLLGMSKVVSVYGGPFGKPPRRPATVGCYDGCWKSGFSTSTRR